MRREVTVELKVTLDGDYIPEGEEIRYIAAWIDMGLYDRENVTFWEFNNWKVSTEGQG
jgi:hypothetical protein